MPQRDYTYCPRCRNALADETRSGRPRRVCLADGCGFVHWDNPVPVVAAIVEHEEQLVLVRSHGNPATWFGLVAGFLEKSEHPDDGMRRELAEEIGLAPLAMQFFGSYTFEWMNQIHLVYHVELASLDIRLGTDELADYRVLPIAQVKPWSRGTGPALRDWLASRGYFPPVVEFGEHV